jgi:hypothetical protein
MRARFNPGAVGPAPFAAPGVPAWVMAALSLGLLAAAPATQAADEVHWTLMGQTAVTFDWRGAGTADTLRYGTSPGSGAGFVVGTAPRPMPDSSPGPFWEARLTGLTENTLYYYRIGNGPECTFRTPPPRGSTGFWFAQEADVGSSLHWKTVAITQEMIAADNSAVPGDDRPRFVLVAGDLTYGDQGAPADVDQHFNDVMSWSREAAYMPAWGNHEWSTAEEAKSDHLGNYEGRFDLPHSQTSPGAAAAVGNGPGEDWYWFDYGNVRFIAFPEPYKGAWSDWAARADAIMDDAQRDAAITFIVTFGHRPSWSSGADHGGESSLAQSMAALRRGHSKYVLSLQGHSHHYERSDPAATDGILFIVGGGGGSTTGGLRPEAPGWSAVRNNHLHHLRIHVEEDRIDGYAICGPEKAGGAGSCVQGAVFDTWSILSPTSGSTRAPSGAQGMNGRTESSPVRPAGRPK